MLEVFYNNLEIICRNIQNNDFDWVHLNVGPERSGKSTLALLACRYVYPQFNSDCIAFDYQGVKSIISKAPKFSAVLLDEGGEALYSRQYKSKESIELNKLMMRMGEKNLFFVINIPDIMQIDSYARNWRARSLTRVFIELDHETKLFTRGNFQFFSWDNIKKITTNKHGMVKYPRSDFYDKFPRLEDKELWNNYLKLKRDYYAEKDAPHAGSDWNNQEEDLLRRLMDYENAPFRRLEANWSNWYRSRIEKENTSFLQKCQAGCKSEGTENHCESTQ